jgi:alpha-beta hydrolase superfamily lysophospholipase
MNQGNMSQEDHFRSADGLHFYARRWEPSATPRANLVLLHGYGEHSGRYEHVARALNDIGLTVSAFDQRGHGRTPGKRGYIRNFDLLIDDLDCYLDHLGERLNGKPLFAMGHSMGGLVLARYVQTRSPEVQGLIFSSPFLAINADVSPVLIVLASLLSALTPWLPVASLETAAVSRDPEVVQSYEADPLNYHGRVLARTGAELNAAIDQARARLEDITAPVYIAHGADDRLVPVEASRLLYERCRSADKTLRVYEGGYHELFNDLDKATVIAELCVWLGLRLDSAEPTMG